MVLYSRSSATYRLVERHFGRLNLPLNDAIELGSIEAIKELVKLGLGISVLARWVVQPQLNDGSLIWRVLPGPRLRRNWVIAMRDDDEPTLIERTFVELCRAASRHVTASPAG
jgi:DNA-binding transcriptional LysR family regulator